MRVYSRSKSITLEVRVIGRTNTFFTGVEKEGVGVQRKNYVCCGSGVV